MRISWIIPARAAISPSRSSAIFARRLAGPLFHRLPVGAMQTDRPGRSACRHVGRFQIAPSARSRTVCTENTASGAFLHTWRRGDRRQPVDLPACRSHPAIRWGRVPASAFALRSLLAKQGIRAPALRLSPPPETCIGSSRLVISFRWRSKIARLVHRVRTQRASAGNGVVGPPSIFRALHILQGTPKRWMVCLWKTVQILVATRARGVSRGSIGCLAATCSIVSRSFIWR